MRLLIPTLLLVFAAGELRAQPTPAKPVNPFPYDPNEPLAKEMSLDKAATYLDGVAKFWMEKNSCGACHANFPYLMARPTLGDTPLLAETRKFLEARQPKPNGFNFDAEAVAIAFALAWDDTRAGEKIQPTTRDALQRMWSRQKPAGRWKLMGCGDFFPAEVDARYTMTLGAIAAGRASKMQARSSEAQDGLTKLRRDFDKSPPSHLHDTALLLWASLHTDGLMTTDERKTAVEKLLAAQGKDGGWSLSVLSESRPSSEALKARSDGYGAAFTIYVLRQAGVPPTRREIARGLDWLRSNQRASGRWFTPAAQSDTEGGVGSRDLYAQNLGTAFAVLALSD